MSITITFPILFTLVFIICLLGWIRSVAKSSDGGSYWGGDIALLLLSFLWWIPVLVMIGIAIGRFFR